MINFTCKDCDHKARAADIIQDDGSVVCPCCGSSKFYEQCEYYGCKEKSEYTLVGPRKTQRRLCFTHWMMK